MFQYLQQRLKSFKFAIKGILDLFQNHPNARIHLLAAFIALFLSFYFKISAVESCVVLLCIALVMAMEAVNSAIEYLADKISPEQNELIGKAKDMAAAAVLICAVVAMLVGGVIFLPRIWALFSNM